MSAISLPKLDTRQLQALAVLGAIIVLYLIYRKVTTAVPRAIAEGKEGLKNIAGTNDQVGEIVKRWFAVPSKNPFNPKFLDANPSKGYWKGADVKRIATAIHDNITDGKEVLRLISMAKSKTNIAQMAKSYADQYKKPLYKDIVENLDKYDLLKQLAIKGAKFDLNSPTILSVQYFHMIVNKVNSLPL